MSIEFTTLLKDYKFSNISDKTLNTIKEKMICTLLFEKVPVLNHIRPDNFMANQTHWNLI